MKDNIDLERLPQHIAIVMDGNGRWAQKNGMQRYQGHQEGVVSLRKVVETAGEIGIKYLTVYTFSTENWKRPQEEVDALMELITLSLQSEMADLIRNNVRLDVIGDVDRLPERTWANLRQSIADSKDNTGLTLILALSYSSRWEIVNATQQITQAVKEGVLSADAITEDLFSSYLTTRNLPDPDLLIRTGGEHRISNYLMWQLAYAELYFTNLYWPEFRGEHLIEAIVDYQSRERRFGKTGEQVRPTN